jgi:CRP/FNR family transcriptional regulator, cyclic AMP receptor protein
MTSSSITSSAKRAEEVHVPAGKALVTEGETGHEFFVILGGTARVTRHGRKLATLGVGASFGELALLEKAPRNATVVAETDMDLLVLGQREFAGIVDEVPGFARKMLAAMAKRLREADARSVQ